MARPRCSSFEWIRSWAWSTWEGWPRGEEKGDDACLKSCADWYGNARPIFYRSRVFALMGYELVEAQLSQRTLQESLRMNFLEAPR